MDWLRSEDLKEEKVVTTPAVTIARQNVACLFWCTLTCGRFVTLWASRVNQTKKHSARNDPCRTHQGNGEAEREQMRLTAHFAAVESLVVENDVEKRTVNL
jgi:hypothetical protein